MNHPVPEELISAYFDGEVSPDERGEVERSLESSSDLRQQLDETSKLSALLHSFPRESAPRELAANVQKQVNAAAQPALVVPQNVASATTRRSLRREWTAFVAGMLATMASLMMFVTFNSSPFTANSPPPDLPYVEPLPQVTFGTKPAAEELLADARPKFTSANLESDVSAESRNSKRSLALPQTANWERSKKDESATQSDPEAKLNEEENLAQDSVPMATNSDMTDTTSNSIQPQSQNDFLSSLAIGNVIVSKVADPNNTVAVVDFTVIDIDRGSDQLKLLLQKRSLQQVEFSDETSRVKQNDTLDRRADQLLTNAKKESSKNRDSNRTDEFQVFFVRATGDQLVGTIDDLARNHPDLVRNWSPQPPIELPVASMPTTEGMLAENSPTVADYKSQNHSLRLYADETTAVNVEAEMAVGVLMARNGAANAHGDFNYNANGTVPLSMSNSIIGKTVNPGQKFEFGTPAAAPVASNPTANASDKNLPENNAQISGNTGQGYFRVSRQNLPHVALQQATPVQNQGTPLIAGSMLNSNLDSSGGLGGGMGRNTMHNNTNHDSRNPRLVRMLFVLKSGQTTNPAP